MGAGGGGYQSPPQQTPLPHSHSVSRVQHLLTTLMPLDSNHSSVTCFATVDRETPDVLPQKDRLAGRCRDWKISWPNFIFLKFHITS